MSALVIDDRFVIGEFSVKIPVGSGRELREKLITEGVGPLLDELAQSSGLVVTAVPIKYVRERPGRDDEGRTVFDVTGFIDGDYLVPQTRPLAQARAKAR